MCLSFAFENSYALRTSQRVPHPPNYMFFQYSVPEALLRKNYWSSVVMISDRLVSECEMGWLWLVARWIGKLITNHLQHVLKSEFLEMMYLFILATDTPQDSNQWEMQTCTLSNQLRHILITSIIHLQVHAWFLLLLRQIKRL